MNLVHAAVRQPVTVAVGVILVLLAGMVSLRRIPIQLTPNVEDTIVAVTTRWEGASPAEIEQDVVDPQEEELQGLTGLRAMTSECQQGQGVIRLEFQVGIEKEDALREVSDKLRQVPSYPENVDEPVIEASDPENRDYIAWFVLKSTDPDFDVRTLQDWAEDHIKTALERVEGVSEINVLGGREREAQVRFDPALLASKGITPSQLVGALRRWNRDVSAGRVEDSKSDVRLRLVGRFQSPEQVEQTVIASTPAGPVRVGDIGEVVLTYKEPLTFVRSRGVPVLAINAQREVGSNVMEVMAGLKAEVGRLNAPGGVLEGKARDLGLSGGLVLTQVFDQTVYIDDALALVQNNIWLGGGLAIAVLLLFLRSLRTSGIVALAIPISIVGAVVAMVALGRSINVISLAGMAFAVGMVVDNAIVVLENVYRHLEMGKSARRAAIDGGREVFGAVLASTLTTVVVFVPILLIEEEAGQLFRDISLAIVASVSLSLIVAVTVIPTTAARLLGNRSRKRDPQRGKGFFGRIPDAIAETVHRLNGSVFARLGVTATLAIASIVGTVLLMPPTDYLPAGNRNLVFGLLIPPPGYSLAQQSELGRRIEETIRPFWEAGETEPGTPEREAALAALPAVPTPDRGEVTPPPLANYFLVAFDGIMFHGGIAEDPERAVDMLPLFAHATRPEVAPGVLAFAFQVPLFRLGGSTGSAIKIDLAGDDLDTVERTALSTFLDLMGSYGPGTVQPTPSNFNVPTPEHRLVPDPVRIREAGLDFDDLAFATSTAGDGAIIGDYRLGGDAIDLKLIARDALEPGALERVGLMPIATSDGTVVPLASLVRQTPVNAPQQIHRVGRQRAVTLQFTPPPALSLGEAIDRVASLLESKRASGEMPAEIDSSFSGSASKLEAVRGALLGDGTFTGTLGSSLVLSLVVVYLVMCILFQSFLLPLVILFSVPLATLGGFAALAGVHDWTLTDPYLPDQKLDVLTMLGFVILIGVVVNNAILIVHQSLNFLRGTEEEGLAAGGGLDPRRAITEAVRSRLRPIFMSTLTSVAGMTPLVLMPGSGSELYRGLGSVVVGGLLVSTVFTLLLVPLLLSLVLDAKRRLGLLEIAGPRETEDSKAPKRPISAGASSALVSLLFVTVLLPTLPGCRGPSSEAAGRERARRVTEARLEAFSSEGGALSLRAESSEVERALAPRLEALERLGGPAAWGRSTPSLGADLQGSETRERPIFLDEALIVAAERNLGLAFSRLGADAAAEGVAVEQGAFDPVLFADLDWEQVERPTPVPVLGGIQLGVDRSASDRRTLQAGVRKLLHTGAVVSASTFLERFDNQTEGIEFLPDPAWRTGLALDVTQPLWRGGGRDATDAALRLAESQRERSREEVESDLLTLGALVEQAYWDLLEARGALQIRERLIGQGETVERVLRERLAFDAERAEYADALATIEARRAERIRALSRLRSASDALKALLDDPRAPVESEVLLVASETFREEPLTLDLRAAAALAVERRPELRAALLDIEDADVRLAVARDARSPRLDLVGRIEVLGEQEGASGAYTGLAQDDLVGSLLALRFELPVGNRSASAAERRARREARAALVRYEETLRNVLLDVKQAMRDVRTAWELLGASRAARLAASENLRTLEIERERRSSLTPEFLRLLLGAQERLAAAELEELAALANYNRALAAYNRALGTGRPVKLGAQRSTDPPASPLGSDRGE